MANKVLYKYGLKQDYINLAEKQNNILFWCIDTKEIYKGNDLFGTGQLASISNDGLMSSADKQKLQALSQSTINFKGVYNSFEEVTNPYKGDIVFIGTKEYIYSEDSIWIELGDEAIYLTKSDASNLYSTKAENNVLSNNISALSKSMSSIQETIQWKSFI